MHIKDIKFENFSLKTLNVLNTRMWGSLEAVETQALILMEVEALIFGFDIDAQPRFILDMYNDILRKQFGEDNRALSCILTDETKFADKLYEICNEIRENIKMILSVPKDKSYAN